MTPIARLLAAFAHMPPKPNDETIEAMAAANQARGLLPADDSNRQGRMVV
jgi:hypothetical protein